MFDAVRGLFADDAEHVTRDGVVRGPERLIDDWAVQLRRFDVTWDFSLHEAADSIVAISRVRRQSRTDPDGYVTSHSGTVFRVRDGRIVFIEAFPDGRDALEAAGLDQSLMRAGTGVT